MHYYRHDLAFVHDSGFAFHADRCAPGILSLLAPVRDGVVLEIGCGSGALTKHLLAAGYRVIATDASPDMLSLARTALGPDADLRRITLPDEPLPSADAVVSVGHVISYLPDAAALDRAVVAMAGALRPGGVLAFDVMDLAYSGIQPGMESSGRVTEDWAIVARYSAPAPDLYVRDITTFVADGNGMWRRDDERHENVLVDTSRLPGLLAEHGVEASVRLSFGTEWLPPGLRVVMGSRHVA
jgi:SAM-dependent methyltransferase